VIATLSPFMNWEELDTYPISKKFWPTGKTRSILESNIILQIGAWQASKTNPSSLCLQQNHNKKGNYSKIKWW